MPVEIRELIIRAFVDNNEKKDINADKDSFRDENSEQISSNEIVQILDIINNKNER